MGQVRKRFAAAQTDTLEGFIFSIQPWGVSRQQPFSIQPLSEISFMVLGLSGLALILNITYFAIAEWLVISILNMVTP